MDRTNGAGHVNHMFVAEDLPTNRPPSEVTPEWLNTLQEELCAIVEYDGGVLDPSNRAQVIAKLQTLFSPRSAGAIQFYAMSTAPSGWLKANGAAVSRTTYAGLFAAIGTVFGVGDGATTFNLPDLRGEFLRGWDDARGIDAGRAFGSWQKGTLTLIDSTLTTPCVVSPLNGDDVTANTLSRVGVDVAVAGNYAPTTSTFISGASVAAIGSGGFEFGSTRPRNIALLACIKY